MQGIKTCFRTTKISCRSTYNLPQVLYFHNSAHLRNQIETKSDETINKNKKIHIPVLLKETLDNLIIKSDGVFLDCTFGEGTPNTSITHNKVDIQLQYLKNSLKQQYTP
jgi:hypothetical protein